MKKFFLILFCVVVIAYIYLAQVQNQSLQLYFKPLIIPALGAYFLSNSKVTTLIQKLLLVALFFSWAGDMLLMFEPYKPVFFIFGLSAFLIAHLFFIITFKKIYNKEKVKLKIGIFLFCLLIYTSLITILYPHLQRLLVPVCVYGLAISIMLLIALHLCYIKKKFAGRQIAVGAGFFVISDACLAINKFYQPIPYSAVIIMSTYALAQFLIVNGILAYNRNSG